MPTRPMSASAWGSVISGSASAASGSTSVSSPSPVCCSGADCCSGPEAVCASNHDTSVTRFCPACSAASTSSAWSGLAVTYSLTSSTVCSPGSYVVGSSLMSLPLDQPPRQQIVVDLLTHLLEDVLLHRWDLVVDADEDRLDVLREADLVRRLVALDDLRLDLDDLGDGVG